MKVINKPWKPRRTAIVERVRRALKNGKTKIKLRTAVDVYGAANIATQLQNLLGAKCRVRRDGKDVMLYINPTERSLLVSNRKLHRDNKKMRRAFKNLKKDQCIVINSPIEAHAFIGLRADLKNEGMKLRSVRNCTSLMVWRANRFPEPIDILQKSDEA
jgi:hypothetical protein